VAGEAQQRMRQSLPYISCCSKQFVILLSVLCWGVSVQAQENKMFNQQEQEMLQHPDRLSGLIAAKKINAQQIPNPHWRKDACITCHTKKPTKVNLHLRDKNVDRLCNSCHLIVSDHRYIHPSGMMPSSSLSKSMSAEFRSSIKRSKGKVSCVTCHDLRKQCIASEFEQKKLNPLFFSGGPYHERSAICYKCHNDKSYKRLNPHDQITNQGQLRKERCGVCHRTLDDLATAKTIEDVDFNIKDDLSKMCTGCHHWKPHPGGAFSFGSINKPAVNHLVKLPDDMQQQYDRQQAKGNVLMPLEPNTGKVFCGTCHNPHEKGVIKNTSAAKGADSEQRLRMVDLCVQCHDK